MWRTKSTAAIAVAGLTAASACATSPLADDAVAGPALFDVYEPNAEHPFGQLNPDAPARVAAYQFMVGRWDCLDTIYRQGEEPVTEERRVYGQHYLNGYGYINHTYGPSTVGVMTYLFDEANATWVVDYTAAPNFTASRWTTVDIGEEGALAIETPGQQEGVKVRSVFHDISADAFHWRLDIATPQGTFSARTSACARTA